jgi:uncharacterized protein (TIGR02145 family)
MKKTIISIIFVSACIFSSAQESDNNDKFYAVMESYLPSLSQYNAEPESSIKSDSLRFLVDKDFNSYNIIKIGNQLWMAENLKTTRFNDGTTIPVVSDGKSWSTLISPGYCWYNNDALSNKSKYGVLYNGYSVSTGKLCPSGWHVPSVEDWLALTTFCGEYLAGGKLKETDNWMSPNTGATNATGFTALPGGSRGNLGSFMDIGLRGHWWSSTEFDNSEVLNRTMSYSNSGVSGSSDHKQSGLSVRCMKDN